MSTDELAAAFYGNSMAKTTSAAPAPAQPSGEQSTAEAFFGASMKSEEKVAVTGARDTDVHDDVGMAKAMYAESPIHGVAERAISSAAREHVLATPEQAAEMAASWVPLMHEFDLNATESSQLTELGVSMTVNEVDADTVEAWVGDAKSALREEYGDRAGEALNAARQLVGRNPAVRQWLEDTKLGSHPQFVRVAAAKAMYLKSRGRL